MTARVNLREIRCRTLLTSTRIPAGDYCINPYVGCVHACRYCYARFMGRYRGHTEPWGRYVDVRINASEVLTRQLAHRRFEGHVLLGTVTDCYQPLEEEHTLMPGILEVLARSTLSTSILTKSDLITRDVDLLLAADARVGLSIASDDEAFRAAFEPGASSIESWVRALETLHRAGVRTYVFVSPIFPGLVDLVSLVGHLEGKTRGIMAEALNPRRTSWREVRPILEWRFPRALAEFRSGLRSPDYWDTVEGTLENLCRTAGLEFEGLIRHL